MLVGQLHPVAEQTYFTKEKEVTLRFNETIHEDWESLCAICTLCSTSQFVLYNLVLSIEWKEREDRLTQFTTLCKGKYILTIRLQRLGDLLSELTADLHGP